MNNISKLTAALIALGVVSQASATTQEVYLTGSTAFRGNVYTALTGSVFTGAVGAYEINGSAPSKCNYMVFSGNIGTQAAIINCAWSGSDAGMSSCLGLTFPTISNDGIPLFGAPETWIDYTKITFTTPPTAASATTYGADYHGTSAPTSSTLEAASHPADLCFADTSVNSALPPIIAANGAGTGLVQMPTAGADAGNIVAVVTFTWAKNNNNASPASAALTAWTDLSNVTTLQLQFLIGGGSAPAYMFTGQSGDLTDVYLIGRNKGSGTRANALNDTEFGLNTPVVQYNVGGNLTGNSTTTPTQPLILDLNGHAEAGISDVGGSQDDGYESGGNVANALKVAGSTTQTDPYSGQAGWIAIGYLSSSDASGIGVGTANPTSNWLTENGVMESDGAIEEGQYSFWGYENMYGQPNIVGTYAETAGNAIYYAVEGTLPATANVAGHDVGINVAFMNAQKLTDFSYPTPF
jgi:hypothetical protein